VNRGARLREGEPVLQRIYWAAWLAGTALIVLSWFGVVSWEVGWVGFAVACGAALLSYLPRRTAGGAGAEAAILSRAMIESKDRGYEAAMAHLSRGGAVLYDGLAVLPHPAGELTVVGIASAPVPELDEVRALQDAERCLAGFEALARLSPELAGLAAERKVRVSLITEYGNQGFEICQVADGRVLWKVKGKGADRIA
jgi:hypothetical protein